MKGRRRARRMALECLYELDQSTHGVETILRYRAQAVLEDALATLGERIPAAVPAALVGPAAGAFLAPDPLPFDPVGGAANDGTLADTVLADTVPGAPWPDALAPAAAASLAAATGATTAGVVEAYAKVTALGPQIRYGCAIVRGVAAARPAIDAVIAKIAPEWPVPQMAPVDRNVLRIALWELGSGSAPLRVVINEAVELAREYVGENSRRMVNGALGTYAAGAHPLHLEDSV